MLTKDSANRIIKACGCACDLSGEGAWKESWEVSFSWRLPYRLCGSERDPKDTIGDVKHLKGSISFKMCACICTSVESHRNELQLREKLLELPWTFLGSWDKGERERKKSGEEFCLFKLGTDSRRRTHTLTSQVWLSRLTAAVLRPMMMANAEFKFLWALQLRIQHISSQHVLQRRLGFLFFHKVYGLTEQRSWWTSWAAALSCWVIRTWAPQTWPTVGPRCSAGEGQRALLCDPRREDGWVCSTPVPAAYGERIKKEPLMPLNAFWFQTLLF